MKKVVKRSVVIVLMLIFLIPLYGMHRAVAMVSLRKPSISHARMRPAELNASAIRTRADVDAMVAITDRHFAKVPGYATVKERLYKSLETTREQQMRGYAYELEVAWYLQQKEKHTICLFDYVYTHPGLAAREIDIVTNLCAVECKYVNWDAIQQSDHITARITKQFTEQAALVRAGLVGVPHFMVCSKNQIPFEWKVWFWQQGILYMEGPN
jgi:hypothetical protein